MPEAACRWTWKPGKTWVPCGLVNLECWTWDIENHVDFKCVWCSWNEWNECRPTSILISPFFFQRFDLLVSRDWICCSPYKSHCIANSQWISSRKQKFHLVLPVLQTDCFGGLRVARNSARLAAAGQSRYLMLFFYAWIGAKSQSDL